jgi:branched-chain amino acid transport system substrate-binding protein
MGTVIRDTIVPYATARRLGWQADFVGNLTSFDLNIPEAPNRATEGLFVMSAFDAAYPDATAASTREWAARYVTSFKVRPNIASQMAYINADLLVRGLRGAGKNLTADTLIQEMQQIRDYRDPFGGPVLSFSEQKHTGTSQMLLQVVKDGRWTRAAPAL